MLVLPEDLLSQIFLHLKLEDVVSLRRVSRHFQRLVSNDKILWDYILGREVSSRNLSLHPNRIHSTKASAAQLESWLRCAILLRQSYSQTAKSTKTRLKLDQGITWISVARARWCIVASSDVRQSRLSVYDLAFDIECCEVFYLSGPVIAGVMDETDVGLRMALTVGTVNPQVVVLELGIVDGSIEIRHLETLEGFAYVIHFLGERMRCCRDWRLIPRVPEIESQMEIQAHVNAIASTEWEGFIVVITNRSLQLYDLTNLDLHDGNTLKATRSFNLKFDPDGDRKFVEEASFEIKANKSCSGFPLLFFSGRQRNFQSFTGALILEKGKSGERKPRLVESSGGHGPRILFELPLAVRSIMGHSFGHILKVIKSDGPEDRPIELLVVSWSKYVSDSPSKQCLSRLTVPTKVHNDGLPMLHFLTSIDFDDAAGIIAMGTSRGDLCLVRFLPDNSWAVDALETSLLKLRNSNSTLSKSPLPMDLEDYYSHLPDVQAGTIPEALVAKVVGTWLPRYERGALSPEWSQDWENYEHIGEWISPWSGWLVSKFSFEEIQIGRGIIQTYRSLGTKGIIIPVAFRVPSPSESKDNEQILLRVGKRLYIVYVPSNEAEDVCIVALPVNFDNAFDSRTLKELCNSRNNWLFWNVDGDAPGGSLSDGTSPRKV
ncbi:hypothetical protein SCHPADRAFT_995808 [Schizopora paradoxa]|uniref:F-box domain-containing protein n=1 Tax=Schizopora paradoxa TaxID=27342 RepID=A0A0H2S1D2_9AGAM|nr:hypothetical protein SCHPADRAFT_995808 [Schizopora paradoxa]